MGSLSDPKDTPGLAHFCEHMLFYASAKYPEEDAYSKFVVSSTSCIPLSAWPAVLYHTMHGNCTKNHALHGNRMSPAVLELLSLPSLVDDVRWTVQDTHALSSRTGGGHIHALTASEDITYA